MTNIKNQHQGESETMQQILLSFGIREQEYRVLQFEIGCRFVEGVFPQMRQMMTQEGGLFWEWWRMRWLKDDAGILKHKVYMPPTMTYAEAKEAMIGETCLKKNLEQLLENKNYEYSLNLQNAFNASACNGTDA